MLDQVKALLRPFLAHVPHVVGAILIFIVGWIVCKIISGIIGMLMKKIKIDESLNAKDAKNPIKVEVIIQKFVYYVLLIYVLLLSLDVLGIQGVLDPVEMMFVKFLGMIPNIVAALFISFLGYVLSRTVGVIVQAAASGLDPIVTRTGISDKLTVSKLLGQLAFIFIFIPIVIAALHVLRITAISQPAILMLEELLTAIPNIIAAALILILFYVLGRLVTRFIAELLQNFGTDDIPAKIGATGIFGKKSFSVFCGNLAFFFIMLFAAISAVEKLQMDNVSGILTELLEFAGNVVLGLIILGIGNFLATFAHDSLAKSTKGGIYPVIVKVAILALVLAMGLHTMGIAENIVEMAFMFIFGTLALTIVLAFGLGGRDAAGKTMEHWLAKLRKD